MAHRGRKNADEVLAMHVASGRTLREAARKAGVAERTATRRAADPEFKQLVTNLRGEFVARAAGRMGRRMVAAAEKLFKLLDSDDERVQLAAAKSLLEIGAKLHESVEMDERLAAVEAFQAEEKAKAKQPR